MTTHTKSPAVRLLVEERRRRILELLDGQERATVEELVARFRVSAVTIRGDLDALADAGSLVRSHGGALKRLDQQDVPIAVKETLHHGEKVRIGHAAARLIRDDETIILDSGTTTAEIARQLKFLKLTVAHGDHQRAQHRGGAGVAAACPRDHDRRHPAAGVVLDRRPQAEQMLRGLYADRLFLGVDGLDPEVRAEHAGLLEAQLNALMIKVSREVTAVADSSKFFRRAMSSIAGLHDVHRIITDDKVDQQIVASLRARSLEVMVV